MPAGMNMGFNVWKISNDPDDVVGGAITTGTMSYLDVPGRFQAIKPSYLLLQQGVQVQQVWELICRPITLLIEEKYEVEISRPINHPYYMKRFVVRAVKHSDMHPDDPRNYLVLSVDRSKYA